MPRREARGRIRHRESGALRWLAIAVVTGLLLVCVAPARGATVHSRFTPDRAAAVYWSKRDFGSRWRTALCVAYTESRYELGVSSGSSYGPWQVDPYYHPWVSVWRLTHSWRYAAAVAARISDGGRDWSAWGWECGA